MRNQWFVGFLMTVWLLSVAPINLQAQESADKKAEEKEAPEKQALALLEQVVTDSAALKLPENRIQLQIIAADLLWTRNEARARSLFDAAVAGIYDLMKAPAPNRPARRYGWEEQN